MEAMESRRITPDEVAALCAETARQHGYALTRLELQSWSSHLMVLGTHQYEAPSAGAGDGKSQPER